MLVNVPPETEYNTVRIQWMQERAFEPSDWASGRMAPSAQRGANAAIDPVANTCSNVLQSELAAPLTPAASSTESATLRFVPASDTAPSASGGRGRERSDRVCE